MVQHYQPDPDRDRRLAAQPRRLRRQSRSIDELVSGWTHSADYRRLERLRRARRALAAVLPPQLLERVRIASMTSRGLTLEISSSMLLAELRNHYHHDLVRALAQEGAGTQTVRYRLMRSRT